MRYLIVCLALIGLSSAGVVTPDLASFMAASRSDELLPIFIRVEGDIDGGYIAAATAGLDRASRREFAVDVMQDLALETQAPILEALKAYPVESVTGLHKNWLVNVISCEATPEVIRAIARRDDVQWVSYRYAMSPMIEDMSQARPAEPTDANAWGVDKIGAPAVWTLGYNGTGVTVAVIDTGVNYNHVDLATHMWHDTPAGLHYGWDMENGDGDPMDQAGHGTHVAGSVASNGTAGTTCGVAPGTTIMAVRVMTSVSAEAEVNVMDGFEWALAHGADILTTSLGFMYSWNPQRALWRTAEVNILAAGVPHSIAAGNEGPSAPSIRCPGDCPPPWINLPEQVATGALAAVVTVGATTSSDGIASFSSRGPVMWDTIAPWYDWNDTPPNAGLIEPDVCAPGDNITSCDYANIAGYTVMSGTSMATPHNAGLMSLMLDANPSLSVAQVDQILEETSLDLGTTGKENIYGAGRIQALQAVQQALVVGIESSSGTISAPGLVVSAVTPNPVSSVGFFDVFTGEPGKVIVTLYDIAGRQVALVSSDELGSGSSTLSFQVPANLGNGVYFLRATSNGMSASSRLTVLR